MSEAVTQSAIPNYHETRMSLAFLDMMFEEYIGSPQQVDVGETLKVMLKDFFYGEVIPPNLPHYMLQDRVIVFPRFVQFPIIDINGAIDNLGEIFWTVADNITTRALSVNAAFVHRPHECFYMFYPATKDLVIYTPVKSDALYPLNLVQLDGRAVVAVCREFLPSWAKAPLKI